jgi:hypothetical protein
MPHAVCGACKHPEAAAIDAAIKAKAPLRVVAKRFRLSLTTIFLHSHHDDAKKSRINIGQIARIDKEIAQLRAAASRAKRRKNNELALNIAKELRSWFQLRVKAEIVAGAQQAKQADQQAITPAEALGLAQAVIESQLDSVEVRSWLKALSERIEFTSEQ